MASVLEEKDAIRELLARYCFHIDLGEYEEWLGLFTEDGVFDLGKMGHFQGRDTLRKFTKSIPTADGVPTLRHCVVNPIVEVNGDAARARSYVVVVQGKPQLSFSVVGRYEDEIVKIDGSWRFKARHVALDFINRPG
jgi:3-phenylpropionate/cinnamic acid dioxygenase small subunit